MSWLLFSLLALLCFVILLHGLLVPGRFYHFPFVAAGLFLGFILPQLPGLIDSRFIPSDAVMKTQLFAILCLGACWLGWQLGSSGRAPRNLPFSEERLLRVATMLALVGAYFFYRFSQLPDEERLRGILTGTAVAYMFFAKLLTYGLAIALLCFAARPSRWALAIILFCTIFYFERIVIAGRRGELAEFAFLIALAFWFRRGWAVPRTAVVAGLMLSVVGLLGASQYRDAIYYSDKADWSSALQINIVENWKRLIHEGGPEMTNAVMAIHHVDETRLFDLGLSHWNWLVFAYVPAQLFGQSFKSGLMVDVPSQFERGYEPTVGSTSTGLTDAFASFWYFGAVKFLLIAALMAWIYRAAARQNTAAQLVYMLSVVPAMLAISHFTNSILTAWVHMAVFLIPALYYARLRDPLGQPVELVR